MDAVALLQRHRRTLIVIVCALATLWFLMLLVLTFGWSHLREPLERHFSRELGRPVTIGALRRVDHSFFSPEIQIGNVHVAQPDWVGGGDMIIVRQANVQLPLLPLLFGQAHPHSILIDGLTVALVRRDAVHANWKGLPQTGPCRRLAAAFDHQERCAHARRPQARSSAHRHDRRRRQGTGDRGKGALQGNPPPSA